MARGETQGKNIAIIILSILMVIGFFLTYVFYDKVDTLQQQAAAAQKNEGEAKRATETAKTNYREIRELVYGTASESDHAAVVGLAKKELGAPTLTDANRKSSKPTYESYSGALTYLQNELNSADTNVKSLEAEKAKIEAELKAVQKQYQGEKDQVVASQKSTVQELADQTAKLQGIVSQREKEIEEITERFAKTRDLHEQAIRDREDEKKRFDRIVNDLRINLANVSRVMTLREQRKFEHKDGSIVMMQRGATEAVIDLGLDDGVRPSITFSVYGRDVGGNPNELPKADLEIVSVQGPHRSLARITRQSDIGDPVLPGDLLYNPVWNKGDKEGIAFVGLMHLDEDSNPDNEAFKKLVERSGGRIDAEVNLKTGQIEGAISVHTGWLVIGDIPESSESKYDNDTNRMNTFLTNAQSQMRKMAHDAGVRIVNLPNFLTYMGYDPPQRTVPSGGEYKFLYGKRRPKLKNIEIDEDAADAGAKAAAKNLPAAKDGEATKDAAAAKKDAAPAKKDEE